MNPEKPEKKTPPPAAKKPEHHKKPAPPRFEKAGDRERRFYSRIRRRG